jgi:penicillin-binding protein 1A
MSKLKLLGIISGVLAALTLAIGLGVFVHYTSDLPSLDSLSDYHPKEISRVYSDDGELIAQFYEERRTVVPYEKIPKPLIKAFLAAEDANFYEHEGLNYLGILRAVVKGVLNGGRFKQGGSTITQQLVKTMVTGPERSLRRKVREAVLTTRVEKSLSKDDILFVYLNQIVFGRGNYGVEEAARAYFGKAVVDVDLAEAAILAGIPKNPEKYNPMADLKAVKERQKYVLGQMVEKGFVSEEDARAAFDKPLAVARNQHPYLGKAPHYAEVVRRELEAKYGAEKLYGGGLTVYTAAHAKLQADAHEAVRWGLREVDKRQGYRGPIMRFEADELARAKGHLEEAFKEKRDALLLYRGKLIDKPIVWDLSNYKKTDFERRETVLEKMRVHPLDEQSDLLALVTALDTARGEAKVLLGDIEAVVSLKDLAWARRFNPTQRTPPPRAISDAIKLGDVLRVRLGTAPPEPATADKKTPAKPVMRTALLVQEPRAEGAFVAIDPLSGDVRAIVGGDSMDPGGLVRATQSRRQPGSSFKGIVYAAALNTRELTPATICSDTPLVFRDPTTGETWKPTNFESDQFDGDLILRTALARSKNTCAVKVLERTGVDNVINMAKALGINTELPRNFTLALGSGEVTPIDIVNAYVTIDAGGIYRAPVFIRKVKDQKGEILQEHTLDPGEARMGPDVAYVLTQMLRAVVEEGTGQALKAFNRPLAGKTGTSSEARDTWFVGFSPDMVAGAWVGFDDNQPLGSETGGKAVVPIWMRAMKGFYEGREPIEWVMPEEGVEVAHIDPKTGLLSSPEDPTGIDIPFLTGTAPDQASSQNTEKDFYGAE